MLRAHPTRELCLKPSPASASRSACETKWLLWWCSVRPGARAGFLADGLELTVLGWAHAETPRHLFHRPACLPPIVLDTFGNIVTTRP